MWVLYRWVERISLLFLCFNSEILSNDLNLSGFPKEFLFTTSTNLTLPKGSYLLRILLVGGGGGGCRGDEKGRGKAGDVWIDVRNVTLSRTRTFPVTVGVAGEIPKSYSGSAESIKIKEFKQISMFDGEPAYGGKTCGNEKIMDFDMERFGHFFMSSISRGRPGRNSNTSYGSVLGGEGGVLINKTGPTREAKPGVDSRSSKGGEGYGAGGGTGGKHKEKEDNLTIVTSNGGHGAQGVVYIEVLPIVCQKPLRVFFALESGKKMGKQTTTVIGLLNYFTVTPILGKVELVMYKRQVTSEFKFGDYNNKDDLVQAIRGIQQDDNANSQQANYTNVFRSAVDAFKHTNNQHHPNDTKTLVIFSDFSNISVDEELLRLKKALRDMGVQIMVIGIAEDTSQKEELIMQFTYSRDYVYAVADVEMIETKYWAQFANMICREPSYYVVKESPMTTPSNPYIADISKKLQKVYNYLVNYDIAKADPNNSTEVERVMTMAGEVIENSQRIPNASQIAPGLKMIEFLEDYGLNMATKMNVPTNTNMSHKHYEAGHIGMTVLIVKTKSVDKLSLSQFIPSNQKKSLRNGHVVLPKEAFAESDHGKVVWLTLNPAMSMGQENDSFVSSSKIMSISVEPKSPHIFTRPVEITFTTIKMPQGKQVSCEFWDNTKRFISPHGAWSSKGCEVFGQNKTSVSCHCNHLTSFAVLTRITNNQEEPQGEHEKYLSIITYIGCSLSMLGCILTIVIHACLPSLRTERSFIHLNLVTAILIAQGLFFAAVSIRGPKGLCFAIGIGLYLFYLSVFTWMLVEGLHIYCLVIRVFHTGHERKRLYAIIGWVIPLVITIICSASFRNDFISDKLCWLSVETGAIWSFVGPALFIIAVNLVILVLVLRVTAGAMISDETKNNPNKSLVRACITLLPILGLTWLFGILAINSKTIVFEYLFCIFNSLQGLLIFLFYCIGSSEVRRECKRKLHNYETKRSLPSSSSGYKPSSKQANSLTKQQSKSTELISQKGNDPTNGDTKL